MVGCWKAGAAGSGGGAGTGQKLMKLSLIKKKRTHTNEVTLLINVKTGT